MRRGAGFFAVCEVWVLSAFSAFAVFADFAVLTVLSAFADLAEPDDLADLAGFTDASVAAVSAVLIFSELLRRFFSSIIMSLSWQCRENPRCRLN